MHSSLKNTSLISPHFLLALLLGWMLLGVPSVVAAPAMAGVKITCPYMPYAPNTLQIMYLTNPSLIASRVYVRGFDDQGRYFDLGWMAVVPAMTVMKVAPVIKEELYLKGFTGGKICFQIWCSQPEVLAYFAYNVSTGPPVPLPTQTEYLLEWPANLPAIP